MADETCMCLSSEPLAAFNFFFFSCTAEEGAVSPCCFPDLELERTVAFSVLVPSQSPGLSGNMHGASLHGSTIAG